MSLILEIKAKIILYEPVCNFKECTILYFKIKFFISDGVVIIYLAIS